MGTSEFSEGVDEAGLSPAEARDVLERVARRESGGDGPDLRPMARVEDVAEALRLDVADVKELLADVRANPRQEEKAKKVHPAAYMGWVVALLAVAWAAFPRPAPPLTQAPTIVAPAPSMPETVPLRPLQEVAVNSEHRLLDVGGVGDHPSAHGARGTGDVDQGGGEQAAGERFRHGDRPPQRLEPRQDCPGVPVGHEDFRARAARTSLMR